MIGGRVAILVVNGFDRRRRFGRFTTAEARRYPWIQLCLNRVVRHSGHSDFRMLIWDNSWLPEQRAIMRQYDFVQVFAPPMAPQERRHGVALNFLASRARDAEYLITLDTDAMPVRDGWIEALLTRLESDVLLAGIYRDEMAPVLRPFIHVSCLAIRRRVFEALGVGFPTGSGQDVGQQLTLAATRSGGKIGQLRRTNVIDFHFLIAGLYGDLMYHHGSGSRRAMFWTSVDSPGEEQVRVTLRNAAFRDLDHLVAVLRGRNPDTFGLSPVYRPHRESHVK